MSTSPAEQEFQRLIDLMARLRAPGGCPWDREQTFSTLKKYLLEETYEVIDAIETEDWKGLEEELGDLLLQPVFLAQLAAEQDLFTIADSLRAINEKLIRRHPHIFGDAKADTADDVKQRWDEIKQTEKPRAETLLSGIPAALPAMLEAREISKRAAKAGFDWENPEQVVSKLHEELDELRRATTEPECENEIGDLFFVLVNLARFYNVDPEQALRATNRKFKQRFNHMEQSLGAQGRKVQGTPIAELEALWQEAKCRE